MASMNNPRKSQSEIKPETAVSLSGFRPLSGIPSNAFTQQTKKARAETINNLWEKSYQQPPNHKYKDSVDPHSISLAVKAKDLTSLNETIGREDFDDFKTSAYSSPDGYSIRYNPISGEKEMFVAGSRNVGDWVGNTVDSVLYNLDLGMDRSDDSEEEPNPLGTWLGSMAYRLDVPRQRAERKYEEIAKREGVEVLYGHSRGGAIVADMNVPGVSKVGLDSAMLIAKNRDMLNLKEGGIRGTFDTLIAARGTNNVNDDLGPNFHSVWN